MTNFYAVLCGEREVYVGDGQYSTLPAELCRDFQGDNVLVTENFAVAQERVDSLLKIYPDGDYTVMQLVQLKGE